MAGTRSKACDGLRRAVTADVARRRRGWYAGVGWLLALVTVSPAGAQPADPGRQGTAMARIVLDQLAAFRRGDWAAAYGLASRTIRAQFTAEEFREMVTRGYAPIADSAGATVLGTAVLDPQHGVVEMRVQGVDGETVDALYEMVEEQGAWKISGVVTKPAKPGLTAGRRAP